MGTIRAHPSPAPRRDLERRHWRQGRRAAGIDEVGRGAWAGPVTVAAVLLPPQRRITRLRDSKLLRPEVREHLAARLSAVADGVGIGHASHHEIDRLGLAAALRLAAVRAVTALPLRPEVCLIDGPVNLLADDPDLAERGACVVGGDRRCASIAAASIVAKVARDALMTAAAPRHPAYGFAANKGYPSPVHRSALGTLGPCALHRRSFAPVRVAQQATLTW